MTTTRNGREVHTYETHTRAITKITYIHSHTHTDARLVWQQKHPVLNDNSGAKNKKQGKAHFLELTGEKLTTANITKQQKSHSPHTFVCMCVCVYAHAYIRLHSLTL